MLFWVQFTAQLPITVYIKLCISLFVRLWYIWNALDAGQKSTKVYFCRFINTTSEMGSKQLVLKQQWMNSWKGNFRKFSISQINPMMSYSSQILFSMDHLDQRWERFVVIFYYRIKLSTLFAILNENHQ